MGLYSGEYGESKIKVCKYFPARFYKTSLYEMTPCSMMMTRPFSKQRNNSSSNHFSNMDAFIVPVVYARRHKLSFAVCRNKPNSCLSLAADTNVDAASVLTVRILAVHLRLNTGFIAIYTSFALGMSLIFFPDRLLLVRGGGG